MASITFYGATGTVTGSRHLLDIQKRKLLVDCGMFQGTKENRLRNWDKFPIPPSQIEAVLLTHSHIDHTGYLPRFCRDGFSGKVYCTHATRDLCEILLKDSAHIQEEDALWANKKGFTKHKPALPLYTVRDAEKSMRQFVPKHYGEDFFWSDKVRIKFKDAGHTLGSAFVDIKTGDGKASRRILFSGDLGRPNVPVLREPVQVFEVDYLVVESTYGLRLHEDGKPNEELERVINESAKRGGVLVIPSFAIGRTQTLLYVIRELEESGKIPVLPVFVDSPMAVDATHIYERHIADQNMASRIQFLHGKQVFTTGNLVLCDTQDKSKAINAHRGPAIIISASGMATEGRILHHLSQRLPHPENTILLAGFQAYGTRGRAILDGATEVKIHGMLVEVRAKIESISGYSGHADYEEILAWLMGFNRPPEKTFIVHGEPESAAAMAQKIRDQFGWEVVIPKFGQSFDLNL
jgi:metallo-beta-lactamase family protein